MSLRLYEITSELELVDTMIDKWAIDHEGDITDFPLNDELDKLEGERKEKLVNIALYMKSLQAEAKAFKEEKSRLQAKERALNSKAERLKGYIEHNINEGEKIEDVKATISWRKSQKVIVECMLDDLPEEFIKIDKSARLDAIKKELKAGEKIEGVRLGEFQNLQVK